MKKRTYLVLILCLLALSFAVIAIGGKHYSASYKLSEVSYFNTIENAEDIQAIVEEPQVVAVSDVHIENDRLEFNLDAIKRGRTFLVFQNPNGQNILMKRVYVHRFGIITMDSYFGDCTGGVMVPISLLIIIAVFYFNRLRKFRAEVRENFYSYRNVMNFGFLVFLTFLLFYLARSIFGFNGIDTAIQKTVAAAELFTYLILPVALLTFSLVSISNINLMRKEGVNWRNMLGFFLGALLCLMTVMPGIIYGYILRTQIVDIFNETGIGTQIYSAFEHSVYAILAYLECILLAAAVFGVRAARRIPAFDKDYIIILGCQVRPDGTLTPLLKSRVDRAVEFAEMQKSVTGKDITYVPLGGKGTDEVISEADAMANYLRSIDVPESRLLIENQSRNTYENIRNSMELIQSQTNTALSTPAVAFSTTNYHVFRAGLIAYEQGYRLEGVGSPTKRYFWINASIREFIATLASERRHHLKVILALILGIVGMTAINYIAILM
ncbi:MAG: YdcF family protein [Mogibacterium sp.]|nr:YdcF family protein [Mogibacterium sp.]